MKTIEINALGKKCQVMIGKELSNFTEYTPPETIIITDEHVQKIYGRYWEDFQTVVIQPGENNKTLATIHKIYHELLKTGCDRNVFLLGIGGGVVTDIAGFVATTYLRGLRFAFIPTTLLAQADAAIGGKNGVNLDGYKNLIGTFNQPEFILCDPEVLKTLPKQETANGFAEVVKHAVISDESLFDFLEAHVDEILKLKPEVINHLVKRSVEIKSEIVQRDARESGDRRLLNFGHTFGHAIEKTGNLAHGAAVSIGMMIAARYAVSQSYLKAYDFERIGNLLKNLGLPVSTNIPKDDILSALFADKKREQTDIHFVVPENIGSAQIDTIPMEKLREFKI